MALPEAAQRSLAPLPPASPGHAVLPLAALPASAPAASTAAGEPRGAVHLLHGSPAHAVAPVSALPAAAPGALATSKEGLGVLEAAQPVPASVTPPAAGGAPGHALRVTADARGAAGVGSYAAFALLGHAPKGQNVCHSTPRSAKLNVIKAGRHIAPELPPLATLR